MDYEKKYKDALERAREFQKSKDGLCVLTAESIFPELKESEDEQIRKGIIDFLWKEKIFLQEAHSSVENNPKYRFVMDAIAWLEKQGEQKPFNYGNANIQQKDFAQKIEPKFKVGDWIIRSAEGFKHNTYLIKEVKDYYVCEELKGRRVTFTFDDVHKNFKLWDISDAKDGDVLVDVYGTIGIFQKNDDFDWSSYCSLGSNGGFRCFAIEHELDGSHPATKEQRDLLFKKIEEAGYQWDAKKKELKLLISNGGDF